MSAPGILIVEDDHVIGLDISQTVQSFDYEVIGVASNGPEAMEIAEARKPDLILMDINLGGEPDGITVAEQMRSRWSVPVVFLTAHADLDTVTRASAKGAFGHLTKPIRPEELRAAMSIALRQHHALNELLESNAWLSVLFASITEGVLAADPDGRVLYLNAQAEFLTGRRLADAYGKPVEEVFELSSVQGQPLTQLRLRTASTNRTGMPEERFILRRPAGQEVLIEETVAPLWSGDLFLGAISVFRDLSAALKFEQAQKWESIGILAAGVAHDFNNLLAIIIGNTNLVIESIPPHSEEAAFLQDASRAGQKAAELISQLLAYAGKSFWRREYVDFAKTVNEIAALLKAAIPEQVEYAFDVPDLLPKIEADPMQVQQIVMNLVINAAEAIGTGPGSISVSASSAGAGEGIFFRVKDTGSGMNAETRSKIFDPFFSTKFLGRGLGLAAVQGIIRSHGGTIDVDTAPGKGSVFTVFFPSGASQSGSEENNDRNRSGLPGSKTILVVDDVDSVCKFAKDSLEGSGFSVFVAENGRSALNLLESSQNPVDVVLLDLSMPVLSGSETAFLIRRRFPKLPICFMSGQNEKMAEAEVPAALLNGCFLRKPFTPEQLVTKIRALLENNATKCVPAASY